MMTWPISSRAVTPSSVVGAGASGSAVGVGLGQVGPSHRIEVLTGQRHPVERRHRSLGGATGREGQNAPGSEQGGDDSSGADHGGETYRPAPTGTGAASGTSSRRKPTRNEAGELAERGIGTTSWPRSSL